MDKTRVRTMVNGLMSAGMLDDAYVRMVNQCPSDSKWQFSNIWSITRVSRRSDETLVTCMPNLFAHISTEAYEWQTPRLNIHGHSNQNNMLIWKNLVTENESEFCIQIKGAQLKKKSYATFGQWRSTFDQPDYDYVFT